MRYTVTKQRIQVIGYIWQPGVGICAAQCDLTPYDMDSIGEPTRQVVQHWIDTHFGDFSEVTDFCADFHVGDKHVVLAWQNEESECAFNDAMYPSDDDA